MSTILFPLLSYHNLGSDIWSATDYLNLSGNQPLFCQWLQYSHICLLFFGSRFFFFLNFFEEGFKPSLRISYLLHELYIFLLITFSEKLIGQQFNYCNVLSYYIEMFLSLTLMFTKYITLTHCAISTKKYCPAMKHEFLHNIICIQIFWIRNEVLQFYLHRWNCYFRALFLNWYWLISQF